MQSKDCLSRDKQVRNTVYAGIEAGKKDCLCKGLKIVYRLPEQGNKCNIPQLKVSLEAIFSEIIRANKKAFIFREGNCRINVLHPSLSKSFALSIYSRDPSCNHDGSLEDHYCVSLFKLKFLIRTLRHMFCLPKPSNISGGKWLRKFRFVK